MSAFATYVFENEDVRYSALEFPELNLFDR